MLGLHDAWLDERDEGYHLSHGSPVQFIFGDMIKQSDRYYHGDGVPNGGVGEWV